VAIRGSQVGEQAEKCQLVETIAEVAPSALYLVLGEEKDKSPTLKREQSQHVMKRGFV
jgi:hypothetical protein